MKQINGIYDGEVVRPVEPLRVPPNSPVIILTPEHMRLEGEDLLGYLERQGRIAHRPTGAGNLKSPIRRISLEGSLLSETVIEDRGEI